MERSEVSLLISFIVLALLFSGRFLYLRHKLKETGEKGTMKESASRDIFLMVFLSLGLMEIILYFIRTLFNDGSAVGIFLGILSLALMVYLSLRMRRNTDDRLKIIEGWKKTYIGARVFLILLFLAMMIHFCWSVADLFFA